MLDDTINWSKIYSLSLSFFRDILKIDTTNPPGNEEKAQDYIINIVNRYISTDKKIEIKKLYTDNKRSNLYIRFKGKGKEVPILLTSHLDVVPANKNVWKYSPFSAMEKMDIYILVEHLI